MKAGTRGFLPLTLTGLKCFKEGDYVESVGNLHLRNVFPGDLPPAGCIVLIGDNSIWKNLSMLSLCCLATLEQVGPGVYPCPKVHKDLKTLVFTLEESAKLCVGWLLLAMLCGLSACSSSLLSWSVWKRAVNVQYVWDTMMPGFLAFKAYYLCYIF